MNNIVIKNERFPLRCDICHQADCFDPQTNYCSRCQNYARKSYAHPPYNPTPYTIKDAVDLQAFRSNAIFNISVVLLPWLSLATAIIGNKLSPSDWGLFSSGPIPWPIVLGFFSVLGIPICGLIGIIVGHITRGAIKRATLKPTPMIKVFIDLGLAGSYLNVILMIVVIMWLI